MRILHLFSIFWLSISLSANSPVLNKDSITHPEVGLEGMVVTQHYLASEVGEAILNKGGNAYDATIAVAFALAVVLPRAGNIGGGGFTVLYNSSDESFQSLDYREKAPLAASKNMYLDKNGDVISNLSTLGYKAIAVPGTVDGMWELHKKYGSMDWKELIAPSIKLAKEGFKVSPLMADTLNRNYESLSKFSETKKIFFKENPVKFNYLLIQKDLAKTLEKISNNGRNGFYKGDVARKIVADMKRNDGLITFDDLENYKSKWRKPLIRKYKNFEVITMPPPSSGGLHLIQMLNILENFDLKSMKHNSPSYVLLLNEVMKYAYADRSQYLGDPDYVDVPVNKLISKDYARERLELIDLNAAGRSYDAGLEHGDTIYLTVADKDGNMVSLIQSNYRGMGSGIVPKDSGFMLQDRGEMFSMDPNHRNSLVGGKRPFHTIIPAFITKNGNPFVSFGLMGGAMQPQGHAQIVVNMIDFDMNLQEAGDAPRIRHMGSSEPTGEIMSDGGYLALESGFSVKTREDLEKLGHIIKDEKGGFGGYQAIMLLNGVYFGASESRKDGQASGY